MNKNLMVGVILGAGCAVTIFAAEPAHADKSGYTLLNPTPRSLMRAMVTDRPDATESPYTVDAGHFQIEMDLVNYTHDKDHDVAGGPISDGFSFGSMNLKMGLCNNVDFHLGIQPYSTATIRDSSGLRQTVSGFGNIIPRLKLNLYGNDGGNVAVAVLPFVKLPTNQYGDHSVDGGILFPVTFQLPRDWSIALMTGVSVYESSIAEYQPAFVNTISLGKDIVGALGGYIEFASYVSAERGTDWTGTVNVGFTYGLTENLQLDAGINFGVTRSAMDYNPFVGVSWRF
jgi:hypothetical protein